jgi:NADH-quinone oxidoreductase subunit C
MSDTTVTDEAAAGAANGDEPATPADEVREGLLARFTEALGDRVVGSHIIPGHELWVRVDRGAWVEAAELAKTHLGLTFFDFLSAIDWLPSPWGRYEDSLIDKINPAGAAEAADTTDESDDDAADTDDTIDAGGTTTTTGTTNGSGESQTAASGIPYVDPASIKQGYAGGDTRFQMLCRLADVHTNRSLILKADLPDDDLRIDSLVGHYAGANWHERECWEMFGITFDGHPGLRHLYLPGAFEGHPLRKDFPLLARLVKPWPGIVDVEPMPEVPGAEGEAAEGEGDAADAEAGEA